MFTQLLATYRLKANKINVPVKDGFKIEDDDVAKRIQFQDTLLRTMKQKKGKSRDVDRKADLQKRIDLITAQRKFTQGKQELVLERREVQYLIDQVVADPRVIVNVNNPNLKNSREEQALRAQLVRIDAALARLEHEKVGVMLAKVKEQTLAAPIPAAPTPLDPKLHTGGALALQQQNLLELQASAPDIAALQGTFKPTVGLAGPGLATLERRVAGLETSLKTTQRLLAAHALTADKGVDPGADKTLGQRVTALDVRLQALKQKVADAKRATTAVLAGAAVGAVGITEAVALSQEIAALVAEQQNAVQKAQTAGIRASEKAAQAVAIDAAVDALLLGGADKAPTPFVKKLLTDAPGPLLIDLRSKVAKAEDLGAKIAEHKEVKPLQELVKMLRNVKENDVVQGFFLLVKDKSGPKPKDQLAQPKDRPGDRDDHTDTKFFALTQSAEGDYNKPANIGKYTYHVTALANILRAAGKGISVTGLSPGQGGLSGGSCEIASTTKDFNGVNIKDASVVNSQNKVAASSNRQSAMKVYISQREDHVDKEMQGGKADMAAQATAIMLRFPIRAEYLGKFGKDPIHLTANLELLDGTPVPPADIEVLVHRDWIGITDPALQKSFGEMFADMIKKG